MIVLRTTVSYLQWQAQCLYRVVMSWYTVNTGNLEYDIGFGTLVRNMILCLIFQYKHCNVHSTLCTMHNAMCTMYYVHCLLCTVHVSVCNEVTQHQSFIIYSNQTNPGMYLGSMVDHKSKPKRFVDYSNYVKSLLH